MSYRTYVNGEQLFGNHKCYLEWLDFVRSQGIEVDEDDHYSGTITDVMGAIEALERIVMRLEGEERRLHNDSLFNLRHIPDDVSNIEDERLLDNLIAITQRGYAFLPLYFVELCRDLLEEVPWEYPNPRLHTFKLKEGKTIHVMAM